MFDPEVDAENDYADYLDAKATKPWLNGRPYYCALCGAGGAERMACEQPDCELETAEAAQSRRVSALTAGQRSDG